MAEGSRSFKAPLPQRSRLCALAGAKLDAATAQLQVAA